MIVRIFRNHQVREIAHVLSEKADQVGCYAFRYPDPISSKGFLNNKTTVIIRRVMLVCIYSYRPMQDEPIYKKFTPSETRGCGVRSPMEVSTVFWMKHNGKKDSTTNASLCPKNTPVSYYKDVSYIKRFHCDCDVEPKKYRHVCKTCRSTEELADKHECKQIGCRYFHSYLEEPAPRKLFRSDREIRDDGKLKQPPCADPVYNTENTLLTEFMPGTPVSLAKGTEIKVVPPTGRHSWIRAPRL